MKKYLLIAGIVIAILAAAGVGGYFLFFRQAKEETVEEPVQEGLLIETILDERPYVTMTPRTDGKEFALEISRIRNAETIEYELVYTANGLSRGVIGSINYQGESFVSRNLLLGSCSRNVCKYDEGVETGKLTLKFRNPDGVRKFESEFHLLQGNDEMISQDENFKVEGSFNTSTYYLVMHTIGLPAEVDGEVSAGPYGIFSSGNLPKSAPAITLDYGGEVEPNQLLAWDGDQWQAVDDFKAQGGKITAEVNDLAAVVVVKKSDTSE